jgi:hypothetical protein
MLQKELEAGNLARENTNFRRKRQIICVYMWVSQKRHLRQPLGSTHNFSLWVGAHLKAIHSFCLSLKKTMLRKSRQNLRAVI